MQITTHKSELLHRDGKLLHAISENYCTRIKIYYTRVRNYYGYYREEEVVAVEGEVRDGRAERHGVEKRLTVEVPDLPSSGERHGVVISRASQCGAASDCRKSQIWCALFFSFGFGVWCLVFGGVCCLLFVVCCLLFGVW